MRDIRRTHPKKGAARAMDDIFCFEWSIDQHGYEIVIVDKDPPAIERPAFEDPRIAGAWVLRRKGGPLRMYRPAEEAPGLARQFGLLPRKPQALLDFANEFGLLGFRGPEHLGEPAWEERAQLWYSNILSLGLIVRYIDSGDEQAVASAFTKYVVPAMTVRLETTVKGPPLLKVVALDLLSEMWLQLAREISNETKFRKCLWCPKWFPYGPGTGHKITKHFCGDTCRQAWNRQKKREG